MIISLLGARSHASSSISGGWWARAHPSTPQPQIIGRLIVLVKVTFDLGPAWLLLPPWSQAHVQETALDGAPSAWYAMHCIGAAPT
ncbi:MAG: hypothetical protein C4346_03480 [Chloroflexota bacterium]